MSRICDAVLDNLQHETPAALPASIQEPDWNGCDLVVERVINVTAPCSGHTSSAKEYAESPIRAGIVRGEGAAVVGDFSREL